MKQTFLMLAAISGALLTGCSNKEIASVDNLSQNAISFHVVGNAAETRATPITPSNLTTTDFDVFAYTADGTAFMGKADTDWAHDGVKIVYKDDKWDYDDPNDLHYWPTEALDFYAVSPGSVSDGKEGMHYLWNFNHNSQKIYYTCFDEYNKEITDQDVHANHDVMYGIAKNQTKAMNGGVVKFTFKHILSQVVFKAKTELATMNVEINSIKIQNVKIHGVFTLPADAATIPTTTNNWVADNSPISLTTVIMNAAIAVNSNSDVVDISSETPILTIPQTLTEWAVKVADTKKIENAKAAGQSYLEISCKIQQSGVYLCGSADAYETIYVPFGASWEPGKRYIYTLIFGGGYDADGNAILKPIEFDAETTDWVDDPNNDPNNLIEL